MSPTGDRQQSFPWLYPHGMLAEHPPLRTRAEAVADHLRMCREIEAEAQGNRFHD